MTDSTVQPAPINPLAPVSLGLGIAVFAGILFCCCQTGISGVWMLLFGIPAGILGWVARDQIIQSSGEQSGEEFALVGLALGAAGAVVGIILIALAICQIITGMLALPFLISPELFH